MTDRLREAEALALVAAKFGPDWASLGIRHSYCLPDEIKICGISEQVEDEGEDGDDSESRR